MDAIIKTKTPEIIASMYKYFGGLFIIIMIELLNNI